MDGIPLILVTNDDGIQSNGLWAAVEAVLPLGEVLVVAPDRQWSGGGRSMPPHVSGRITPSFRQVNGQHTLAYAVDASPALAVEHGVLELAPRRPSLVVSGINFGFNLATEVTISGTVGAALEAAAFGIPALAVSLEMAPAYHLTGDASADYAAAQAFVKQFACYMLSYRLPYDVDVLSVNVPAKATPETSWRMTRLSRRRYFEPTAPDRNAGQITGREGRLGYQIIRDPLQTELGSDIWVVSVEQIVSFTPLSLDLTARVDLEWMRADMEMGVAGCQNILNDLMIPCPQPTVTV